MRIYAFRKNKEKKTNSVVLEMTKDDFIRLQSKLYRFVLLNNFEQAKKLDGIFTKRNMYIEKVFAALAMFLKNNDNLKYFKNDEMTMKFVIISCDDKILETYRKHFLTIFKIFDNNVNVNKIVYTDNECMYRTTII